jgi:hypothetical protein
VVAPAALPVGRGGHSSLGGFEKGVVRLLVAVGVAARVVGRLPQLAPNAPKVPCAVFATSSTFCQNRAPIHHQQSYLHTDERKHEICNEGGACAHDS